MKKRQLVAPQDSGKGIKGGNTTCRCMGLNPYREMCAILVLYVFFLIAVPYRQFDAELRFEPYLLPSPCSTDYN